MMKREECLEVLRRLRGDRTVVVTTMAAVDPWARLLQSSLDFPSAGSAMGHAADFGMGVALAQPGCPVWVLNGDASMLMSLGTIVTICQAQVPNLFLFVMQNDTLEVTGNQPIPGAGKISMVRMAGRAGFQQVDEFHCTEDMSAHLPDILRQPGPTFINLRIEAGTEPPPKLDCPLRVPARKLRRTLLADTGHEAVG